MQAPRFECLSFDPFPLLYNGLITSEVDIAHATVMARNSDMFAAQLGCNLVSFMLLRAGVSCLGVLRGVTLLIRQRGVRPKRRFANP
jgi:hypothetical protein